MTTATTLNIKLFEQQVEAHSQVADEATQLTLLASETLKKATTDFSETVENMKKRHKIEIRQNEKCIKILVAALIIVTICFTSVSIKLITNRC